MLFLTVSGCRISSYQNSESRLCVIRPSSKPIPAPEKEWLHTLPTHIVCKSSQTHFLWTCQYSTSSCFSYLISCARIIGRFDSVYLTRIVSFKSKHLHNHPNTIDSLLEEEYWGSALSTANCGTVLQLWGEMTSKSFILLGANYRINDW